MATVLVTDGEQRAALATVRSLGAAGHRVFVCGARARTLAGASRSCIGQVAVPDPLQHPEKFVDALRRAAAEFEIETLIPISEAALSAVLPRREQLHGIRIPFASYDQFRRICDKASVMEAAGRVGIRVPEQHVLATPAEGDAPLHEMRLRFPMVIKPTRSIADSGHGSIKTAVVHVAEPEALAQHLERMPASAYPLLLQERIVGPGTGIFLLLSGGRLRAAFAHRRLREKPVSGGVSVYRESIPMDPELLDRSLALLAEFAWEGVAMVEFKRDEVTGTPYIMEINGRLWGSLQLAIDSGVDFPRLLLDPTTGPAPLPDYRLGVRSRWEWGDADHLLARLRHSRAALSLPDGAPGRVRAIADFLRAFGPGTRAEVFRMSDPAPFARETLDWLRRE